MQPKEKIEELPQQGREQALADPVAADRAALRPVCRRLDATVEKGPADEG
jgi:hypothetical protein